MVVDGLNNSYEAYLRAWEPFTADLFGSGETLPFGDGWNKVVASFDSEGGIEQQRVTFITDLDEIPSFSGNYIFFESEDGNQNPQFIDYFLNDSPYIIPSITTTPINNSPNNSSPPTYSCTDYKPLFKSDLFEIRTTKTSAKIFFTPLSDTNKYFISFSTNPGAEEHGTEVTLTREGVQNFTIDKLKSNTTYYIKVRGQNGCMPGDWSNIMKFKTNYKTYYKYSPNDQFISNVKGLTKTNKQISDTTIINNPAAAGPTITPTQSTPTNNQPISTPEVKKKCFLWWCW